MMNVVLLCVQKSGDVHGSNTCNIRPWVFLLKLSHTISPIGEGFTGRLPASKKLMSRCFSSVDLFVLFVVVATEEQTIIKRGYPGFSNL